MRDGASDWRVGSKAEMAEEAEKAEKAEVAEKAEEKAGEVDRIVTNL